MRNHHLISVAKQKLATILVRSPASRAATVQLMTIQPVPPQPGGASVQAWIRVTAARDALAELTSLREWLGREAAFRGRVQVERQPIEPGQMGGVTDTLTVALGAGGTVTVLANSVSVWLRQRRSDVKIEVSSSNGKKVTVTAERVPDPVALIRTVLGTGQDAE